MRCSCWRSPAPQLRSSYRAFVEANALLSASVHNDVARWAALPWRDARPTNRPHRSIAWYEDTLGMTCAYHGDTGNNIPGAFFDVGDTILAMLLSADPGRDLSEQHFAFAVDSADAAYADLVERGHTASRG